jgi:ankyrin repeat protein
MVDDLIAAGADVNKLDRDGESPLNVAVGGGYARVVQALLAAGARLDDLRRPDRGATRPVLQTAVVSGRLDIASALLDSGADPNAADTALGTTAMGFAAAHGRTDIVELLAARGADPRPGDSEGRTPMHLAAEHSHLDTCRALHALGAPVDVVDGRGDTPLQYAMWETAPVEVLVGLVELGAAPKISSNVALGQRERVTAALAEDPGLALTRTANRLTPVHVAALYDRPAEAALLLEAGADVESRDLVERTPLLDAAWKGSRAAFDVLVAHGARLGVRCHTGLSALSYAAKGGSEDIVRYLLDHGADARSVSQYMDYPLPYACMEGHLGAAKILLAAGAPYQGAEYSGFTPLRAAATGGDAGIVEWLVESCPGILNEDDEGAPSLVIAALEGHLAAVSVLLAAGTPVDARTPYAEHTALHDAALAGHGRVVEELLGAGAAVDVREGYGRTPLHMAVFGGHAQAAAVLIRHGASAYATDMYGRTPLDYSELMGDSDMLSVLRAR